MSKLQRKGSGIDFGNLDDDETPVRKDEEQPRTAIGAISASLAMGRGVEAENRSLKERVQELEGREFVEMLDPKRIRPSKFANRHESSFHGPEYEALKEEIAGTGRNVQAIKVRPVSGDPDHDFEIVFGHRRHRACLHLGIPVAAVVAQMDDLDLFEEMDRENRDRESLSPWEQGRMYRRALDLGLYPSARKLATALGVSNPLVSVAIQLASLPDEVVAAFPNAQSLQYRFAEGLTSALEADRDAVLRRAGTIIARGGERNPKEVFASLLADPGEEVSVEKQKFLWKGKQVGTLSRDSKGGLALKIKAGALPPAVQAKLAAVISKFFED
jgi:ParB family chromosome partitioning protein